MKAIIIDDEQHCVSALETIIKKHTDVQVVKSFTDSLQAAKEVSSIEAKLLFIDIEMPFLNGFEFLNLFSEMPWKVIFTTAYDEYAIQAFKVHAVDYLLKPIDKTDLIAAIEHCKSIDQLTMNDRIQNSISKELNSRMQKIAIPSLAGLDLVAIEDILYLESDSNYTQIHMLKNEQLLVSKTLKSFESQLTSFGFIRVHHSFLVNPNHIKRYVRGDGGYVIMSNEQHINVSRSKKEALLNIIQPNL